MVQEDRELRLTNSFIDFFLPKAGQIPEAPMAGLLGQSARWIPRKDDTLISEKDLALYLEGT